MLVPGQGSDRLVGVALKLFADPLFQLGERLMQVECQVTLQVLPEPLDRIELRAVWGQEDQSNVVWNRKRIGFMEPPVVQNQDIDALGKSAGECLQEVSEAIATGRLTFEKKSVFGSTAP